MTVSGGIAIVGVIIGVLQLRVTRHNMPLGVLGGLIRTISATSDRRWQLYLALAALVPRLMSAFLIPTEPAGDFSWYFDRANELANGLGYQQDGVPTSFWPPGYPFVLSLVVGLFGRSVLAGMLLNAVLGTLICLLTYQVARRIVTETRARMAGLLAAFFPSQILSTNLLGTEILFTALLYLLLYLLLARPASGHDYRYAAIIGVAVGLASYVKVLVILTPLVIFVWWLLAGVGLKRATGSLAVVFLSSLAMIAPWTIRNLVVMGEPILMSTSGGPNLWIGNNPEASGYFYYPPGNPLMSEDLTEVDRDCLSYRLALKFAREDPLRVIVLMPKKVYHLLASDVYAADAATQESQKPVPPLLRKALATLSQHYYLAVVGLALAGVTVFREWWRHPGVLLILVIGYWAMVHALFFGADRFHFPLVPIFCIISTSALGAFWAGVRLEESNRQSIHHDCP